MPSPTDIRKGKVILYNGAPHVVTDAQHRTQGRQAGFMQVALRNLHGGGSTTTKFRSTDSVEFLETAMRKLEFSYVDRDEYHFLDPVTFEDIVLGKDLVADDRFFLREGLPVEVFYVEDAPVQLQLPASVELEVAEAPDGLRGDTGSTAMKSVTTVSGLVIQTPLFVKSGDVIRVRTDDRSYLGRA